MKLPSPQALGEVAQLIKARLTGPADAVITGINEIHKVQPGDLTYADHPKFYGRALDSPATAVLFDQQPEDAKGKVVLIAEDPFRAFNGLLKHFAPYRVMRESIDPSAVIGEGTVLEPGVVIGAEVVIGKDCLIHPNVVIYENAVIGDRVEIHANAVIGSHAFYFKTRNPRRYEKLHSTGRVIIGDDVEIGAGTTVDKGATGDTVIGRGSKLDNLVHIAHGVVIGEDCLFAAQVGIAGKTIIGDRCVFWGQVGVSKDLRIADEVAVLAQSGVSRSLREKGKSYLGSPAIDARSKLKEMAAANDLHAIWRNWKDQRGD